MLADAAATAGLGVSTSTGQAIVASEDRLRLSWLLRSGPVGFEAQYPAVYQQCFVATESWCFGSGFPTSVVTGPFGPAVAPGVPPPWLPSRLQRPLGAGR